MKADRIVETGVDLEKLGILAAVRMGLAPWASSVDATLDKLNLYSRGGVRTTKLKVADRHQTALCAAAYLTFRRTP